MDNYELVTVIIPVFNVYPYLAEAIDSVLQQTYDNLEILIIDDGSSDGSERICDEYAKRDNRIHVVHQDNKGLSAARNLGLDMATGDVIAFLDSDDAYHPDCIRMMMSAMVREKADLVVCDYSLHHTAGKMIQRNHRLKKNQTIYSHRDALRALADEDIDHHAWDKLYNRELWKEIRYPVGRVYEDIDTTYRVIDLCEKVCVLGQPLYLHRRRSGSIATICSEKNIRDSMLANRHFTSFVSRHIPDLFTEDNLLRSRRAWLVRMIDYYSRLSWKEKTFKKELKREILQFEGIEEIEKGDFPLRFACWMISKCPWLFKTLYLIHHAVRHMTWKR